MSSLALVGITLFALRVHVTYEIRFAVTRGLDGVALL